ncbi:Gfo/Idh/MocA family oxidoreductase [Opitutales bacterium ASA1]|uniref:Gfo/Idh/MocA family oxidoreductase n=1 Tax=Congregicoccus parvus TaxID=3081749 RepID=UPI002B2887E6|nr:Gfo/Idh/MocA family oxidoreductase [Opitutales bacterium ASA1]
MSRLPRREFLKKSALATAALTAFSPRLVRAAAPDKVNLACVGIGNRGRDVVKELHATGLANIVALCDTELEAPHTQDILRQFPDVPRFTDFRRMFDKLGKQFDAVCISTPDFSHFPVAMLAMSQGKHVYCEKPAGQTFREIALMMAAEKKYGVAAQMGNQGHSEANYFQFKAWTEAGVIRNVTKITTFMNSRRRWHGMTVDGPLPAETVPAALDWDAWLSASPTRDFNKGYLNGEWRSWYHLGNGALGDWGAHIFDTAHEFLRLGLPTEIEPKLEGWSPFIFPQASTLAFRFPARGALPPCELTWYDGLTNLPPLPENMGTAVVDPNIPPPSSGTIDTKVQPPGKVIYGEGMTFKGGSHGSTLQILGPAAADLKLPEVPRSPSNHFKNFLLACKGEEKCRSSFAVAGPLCQTMALGIISQRYNAKLTFDPVSRRITNHAEADAMLDGLPPRAGWEQYYRL